VSSSDGRRGHDGLPVTVGSDHRCRTKLGIGTVETLRKWGQRPVIWTRQRETVTELAGLTRHHDKGLIHLDRVHRAASRGRHRRLERTLPTLHLDQDRRRDTHQSPTRSKIIVHAPLGCEAEATYTGKKY